MELGIGFMQGDNSTRKLPLGEKLINPFVKISFGTYCFHWRIENLKGQLNIPLNIAELRDIYAF